MFFRQALFLVFWSLVIVTYHSNGKVPVYTVGAPGIPSIKIKLTEQMEKEASHYDARTGEDIKKHPTFTTKRKISLKPYHGGILTKGKDGKPQIGYHYKPSQKQG